MRFRGRPFDVESNDRPEVRGARDDREGKEECCGCLFDRSLIQLRLVVAVRVVRCWCPGTDWQLVSLARLSSSLSVAF